jgi:uncharacterized membrane protein YfcA
MSNIEILLLLALIGAMSGLICGLVGLAGGIIIVPGLVTLFGPQCMPEAIVISFFVVLLNSLSASRANWRIKGAEQYWALINRARWFTLGAIGASCAVAFLFGQNENCISIQMLAFMQMLLAFCMSIPLAWFEACRFDRAKWKDSTVGSIVGGVSTLIGVSGGTYTIFYFMIHGTEIKDCTMTANFVGIFIGFMSLIGYYGYFVVASASNVAISAGFMDLTGKLILMTCGILAAPVGVKLQRIAPSAHIKKLVVYVLATSSSYIFFFV